MTTLIFVQHDVDVTVAWDSQVTGNGTAEYMREDKVFSNNGTVFGVSGLISGVQALKTTELPEYDGSDSYHWVVVVLVPAIRQALSDNNLLDKRGRSRSNLLVVVDAQVYNISPLFEVMSYTSPFVSIGTGSRYATGALMAGATAKEAIQIAAELDLYTGGDLRVRKASELIAEELDG